MRIRPSATLRALRALLLIAVLLIPAMPGAALAPAPAPTTESSSATSPGPLFIENVGQFDPEARFHVRGSAGSLWLAQDALWLTVMEPAPPPERFSDTLEPAADAEPRQGVHLRLSFVGANPAPRLEPFDRSETIVSHFFGNDPDAWRPDVPVWGGVRYVDLYPGLDLEISGAAGQWAWRMVATEAAAAWDAVALRVEGAETLTLDGDALHIETAVGALALPLLEGVDAQGRTVTAQTPCVQGDTIATPFVNALYGAAVMAESPVAAQSDGLVYSTFLGGIGLNFGYGIALDAQGQAYITGETTSSSFPTTPGAFDIALKGERSLFVSVLNSIGSDLVYSTYLGGAGADIGHSIAVDGQGRAYVTGMTSSANYPTTHDAYAATHNGGTYDAFVTVLNPTGTSLVYSTFLGGDAWERADGIAVDGQGQAFVTGITSSSDFPTTPGAFATAYNGGSIDAFVTVLNPTGTDLVYSTLLGGSSSDRGSGIAVDGQGQAYVTGSTSSNNYPTTPGAYAATPPSGIASAYVTVLNPTGTGLVYSTFLGGGSYDYGYGIALDGQGQAFVTGVTQSPNFPTTHGAFATSHNGGHDAFVTALNPAGTDLVYSTFLGGSDGSYYGAEGTFSHSIAVDGQGRAFVTGYTAFKDYPTTPGALDRVFRGGWDAFVTVLNSSGTDLVYSTFLGGSGDERGHAIAVNEQGHAYVTGITSSPQFPTTPGAYDTTRTGSADVFVTVFGPPIVRDRLLYLPIALR